MIYLLDTNVIVDLTGRRGVVVRPKIEKAGFQSLAKSAISLAELEYGEAKIERPSRSLAIFRDFLHQIPVLSFEEDSARIYGQIRADLERKGSLIGANDLLIASIALSHNLILVTRDLDEFRRVDGLSLEDWSK